MPHTYPIMLDVRDQKIVIVGAGKVAVRKVTGLLEAGANKITIIAPDFHAEMPDTINRIVGQYESTHLSDAKLAFAATNSPEINQKVVEDCRAKGIWVNRADAHNDPQGDFSTPATLQAGAVTLAVSTSGSPAIAAKIRDDLTGHLDPKWIALASAMQTIRPKILAMKLTSEDRQQLFKSLATEEAAEIAKIQGEPGLQDWLTRSARFSG